MAQHRGPDQDATRHPRGDPTDDCHEYQLPTRPALAPEEELELAILIQRGNAARDELISSIVPRFERFVQDCDVTPLSPHQIISAAFEAVEHQVIAHSTSASDQAGFASALVDGFHVRIAGILHSSNGDGAQSLDPTKWLDERMPRTALVTIIPNGELTRSPLWQHVAAAESAIQALIESHMRLAAPFARRAMRQPFEYDDLMNEASLILRRAALRFDPSKGHRFSSYAKRALQRELPRRSPTNPLKRHTYDRLQDFNETSVALGNEHGCAASDESVLDELELDKKARIEIENVRRLLSSQRPLHDDPDYDVARPVVDYLPDPFDAVLSREQGQQLPRALGRLSDDERRVVIDHFIRGQSFRAMARSYRKSPHTLSALYKQALDKLRRFMDPDQNPPMPR